MGTRSRIAIRNDDGTFSSIYAHWDGYPSHNGVILKDHYDTTEKVKALIAKGSISSLGETLEATSFHADRGEEVSIEQSENLDDLFELTQDSGGEWVYVWTGHGWQCAKGGIAFFGMPADKAPEGLESIDYWIGMDMAGKS